MLKRLVLAVFLTLLFFALNIFVGGVQSQGAELPPLTEPGPYGVRIVPMTFVDESRDDYTLEGYIWYPADKTQGTPAMPDSPVLMDAPPDRSGAPYPLILYSHGWQSSSGELPDVKAQLASLGFVVAAAQHHDTRPTRFELVDRPLDILLMLDELAAITEGDLAGMIDTNNVGLMGYSQGAETVFQMLGLLRDPVHYASWCAEHPDLRSWDCIPQQDVGQWPLEEIEAYRTQLGLKTRPDGTWEPFGDDRIRAVLAMAPGDFPFTTDDMLASVTTPTMILHGTRDLICDYEGNAARTYNLLGAEDRYLLSVVGGGHLDVVRPGRRPQHFATAFFGYYLQGNQDMAAYLTREQVETWRHVAWGPYEGE